MFGHTWGIPVILAVTPALLVARRCFGADAWSIKRGLLLLTQRCDIMTQVPMPFEIMYFDAIVSKMGEDEEKKLMAALHWG